jgi:hypothetical protein
MPRTCPQKPFVPNYASNLARRVSIYGVTSNHMCLACTSVCSRDSSRRVLQPPLKTTMELSLYLASLPEWKDENRRRALFGALPLRSVNENAYLDRMNFWRGVITETLKRGLLGERTILTVTSDLPQKFQSAEGTVPRSLPGVLAQLVREGRLVDIETFFAGTSKSSVTAILGLPLRWLWSTFAKSSDDDDEELHALPLGRFVAVDAVEVRSKLRGAGGPSLLGQHITTSNLFAERC